KILRWVYSAFFVTIGWVIFYLTDFSQMLVALKMMFNFTPCAIASMVAADSEIATALVYVPLGLIFMLPVGKFVDEKCADFKEKHQDVYDAALNVGALLLFLLSTCFIVSTKFNPFIYFRF
ncbi:MAG: hypothetical protein Q4E99_01515, partial [Bacillota bacterium]|nr:hypothetical protein [Bacillota bacterium]